MTLTRRNLAVASGAALTLGVTWALATGVVNIFPATLTEVVSLPSETITSIEAAAIPPSGQTIYRVSPVTAGTPGPYSVDLTVDGGDPHDASNPGIAYRPYVYASVSLPGADQAEVEISRNTTVTLDNTESIPIATVATAFSYATSHINGTVAVTGGTVSQLQLYASANDSQSNESYWSYSYKLYSTTVATTTVPMALVATPTATVYGTAYVVAPDGSISMRQLAQQVVSLGTTATNVSWTIDLTDTGTLDGDIVSNLPTGSAATPSQYYVFYQGVSDSTYSINGNAQIAVADPTYSFTLPPGDYSVFLRSYFNSPSQYVDTPSVVRTVEVAKSVRADFTNDLAVARVTLNVDGVYTKEQLSSATSSVIGTTGGNRSAVWQLTNQQFEQLVPPGAWQIASTEVSLYDPSNTAKPLRSYVDKYPINDPANTSVTIGAGADATLGSASFTLVKSDIYFDVVEPKGTPVKKIINPYVWAEKYDYNPDSSIHSQTIVQAFGSSLAQDVSGFTMVAEPGEYQLRATATVDGTMTQFSGSTITFGEPINTSQSTVNPDGTYNPVAITLTPVQNADLKIDVTFGKVTDGGVSTVVETPLGPAPPPYVLPPEGFQTSCDSTVSGTDPGSGAGSGSDDGGPPCTSVYYDITTTATWQGSATVCVRRLFDGLPNGSAEILNLYHWNTSLTPAAWERLPPPPGMDHATIDCGSSEPADLAACGCTDEASCGIDIDSGLDVFLICGVTTSFSPFAVFQDKPTFTNVVGGVTYTGPTGPASLQQWTAPAKATYRITATGARGASATSAPALAGGCGAEIAGDFTLDKGDVIQMLVGQAGTAATNNAGGGGGTFVIKNNAPLVIAGGGGGVRSTAVVNGRNGTTASAGTAGSTTTNYASGFVPGGSGGAGGSRVTGYGNGGGGWSGNGAADATYGEGGFAFQSANQGKGGAAKSCGVAAPGGYGGGGAGNGCYGAGGGGGYSGGGGGRIGGGGGSLNNGQHPSGTEGVCTTTGHGRVIIERVMP